MNIRFKEDSAQVLVEQPLDGLKGGFVQLIHPSINPTGRLEAAISDRMKKRRSERAMVAFLFQKRQQSEVERVFFSFQSKKT